MSTYEFVCTMTFLVLAFLLGAIPICFYYTKGSGKK